MPTATGLGTSHEPSWCPLVASSRCLLWLSHHWHFLPIPGSYSWDRSWSILSPLCPLLASCHQHTLQALCMASATSSCPLCGHGHPQMPVYTHQPWHLPGRVTSCILITGTLQKPKQKLCGFYSDLWPSGPHHLAFHLHPKSHFNYTLRRDHFRELLFGAKC